LPVNYCQKQQRACVVALHHAPSLEAGSSTNLALALVTSIIASDDLSIEVSNLRTSIDHVRRWLCGNYLAQANTPNE